MTSQVSLSIFGHMPDPSFAAPKCSSIRSNSRRSSCIAQTSRNLQRKRHHKLYPDLHRNHTSASKIHLFWKWVVISAIFLQFLTKTTIIFPGIFHTLFTDRTHVAWSSVAAPQFDVIWRVWRDRLHKAHAPMRLNDFCLFIIHYHNYAFNSMRTKNGVWSSVEFLPYYPVCWTKFNSSVVFNLDHRIWLLQTPYLHRF